MTEMTFSQFAEHIDVSPAFVTKLKDQGRLVLIEKPGRKKPMVNVEASVRLYQNTMDMAKAGNGRSQKNGRGSLPASSAINDEQLLAEVKQSQAHEMKFKALQTELKYLKEAGELVEADLVKLTVTNIFTDVRLGLERLPDRIADKLSTMEDPLSIHEFLTKELDAAMLDISEALKHNTIIDMEADDVTIRTK